MIKASTRILGVIGNPVGHSLSPVIHNTAIAHVGCDHAYVAFEPLTAEAAIDAMRALKIRGFSVTIPFKESVIPFLDRLDPAAEHTGSVNTVVNDDGVLTGYSTDGAGAVGALTEAGVSLAGKRVRILGSGGAARAIAFALLNSGVETIELSARNEATRGLLARALDDVKPGTSVQATGYDILINTTPVGMSPHKSETPVPASELREGTVVMDIVYNPRQTMLLADAKKAGSRTIDGIGMFVEQAALQFELFTGADAPRELMRKTVLHELGAE